MMTLRGKRAKGRSPRVNVGIDQRKRRSPFGIKEVAEFLLEKSTSQFNGKPVSHRLLGSIETEGMEQVEWGGSPSLLSRRGEP